MPTSGTNKAVRTTTLRSQYAHPMTPTKSMSSTSSSPPAQGMTITEPHIEITDILQQHRVSIQEDRIEFGTCDPQRWTQVRQKRMCEDNIL